MKNKDKLVKLIRDSKCVETWDYHNDKPIEPCPIERLAQHLHENSVVELPCNPGDTVWFIRNLGQRDFEDLIETKVEKIVIKSSGIYLKLACNAMYETSCNSIGKTVFFEKEKAEKKLLYNK